MKNLNNPEKLERTNWPRNLCKRRARAPPTRTSQNDSPHTDPPKGLVFEQIPPDRLRSLKKLIYSDCPTTYVNLAKLLFHFRATSFDDEESRGGPPRETPPTQPPPRRSPGAASGGREGQGAPGPGSPAPSTEPDKGTQRRTSPSPAKPANPGDTARGAETIRGAWPPYCSQRGRGQKGRETETDP